jgi:hypothetical protein
MLGVLSCGLLAVGVHPLQVGPARYLEDWKWGISVPSSADIDCLPPSDRRASPKEQLFVSLCSHTRAAETPVAGLLPHGANPFPSLPSLPGEDSQFVSYQLVGQHTNGISKVCFCVAGCHVASACRGLKTWGRAHSCASRKKTQQILPVISVSYCHPIMVTRNSHCPRA